MELEERKVSLTTENLNYNSIHPDFPVEFEEFEEPKKANKGWALIFFQMVSLTSILSAIFVIVAHVLSIFYDGFQCKKYSCHEVMTSINKS